MIAIVDYGLGNINAFANVYKKLNIPFSVVNSKAELSQAKRIILPGVGAFDHAMKMLNKSGLRDGLDDAVLKNRIPVLGICVGMQMMAETSEEGVLSGLGWVAGAVKKFNFHNKEPQNLRHLPLPHMGWNTLELNKKSPLLRGLSDSPRFYFLHSYYFECKNSEDALANANYGGLFSAVVNVRNVYGIQCHPEKSHGSGIQLLKNFAEI